MDLFDDEPSERAVRAVIRYAVREAQSTAVHDSDNTETGDKSHDK